MIVCSLRSLHHDAAELGPQCSIVGRLLERGSKHALRILISAGSRIELAHLDQHRSRLIDIVGLIHQPFPDADRVQVATTFREGVHQLELIGTLGRGQLGRFLIGIQCLLALA